MNTLLDDLRKKLEEGLKELGMENDMVFHEHFKVEKSNWVQPLNSNDPADLPVPYLYISFRLPEKYGLHFCLDFSKESLTKLIEDLQNCLVHWPKETKI